MRNILVWIKKKWHIVFVGLLIVVIAAFGIDAARKPEEHVVINEVCTSNVRCCEDENGEFPDWIEIYNPTDKDMDISGYIINDSIDLILNEKFVIPEGTVVAPGAYYLFDPHFLISSEGVTMNLLDRRRHYIDRVEIPALKYDTTYARMSDGSYEWAVKQPTPGYSNSDGEVLPEILEGYVIASRDTGFYDKEFDLILSASNIGRDVYYTLDGSNPVDNGILYDGPIHIRDRSDEPNIYAAIPDVAIEYTDGRAPIPTNPVDKGTLVRAVAKDKLGKYTEVSDFVYFVGFENKKAYDKMPIVSIVSDPYDLFSKENGIMVLGDKYDAFIEAGQPEDFGADTANFIPRGRVSERDTKIEIYDENRSKVLATNAGIRIKGMSSRWDLQKSFSVIFRRAYGGKYKESFTVDGIDMDLHSIALDKGGQDVGTKMKDTIMEECMKDTDCATTDRAPCALFVNGEYWGFYWLTQKLDNSFIADKYGVDINKVLYVNIIDFQQQGWNQNDFDRQSLIDCYAANVIIAHARDWPNYNFRVWKTTDDEGTKFGDGKYRPVIFDVNSASMEEYEYDLLGFMNESFYPFASEAGDEEFRKDVVARIDEMRANEFEKDKILAMIDDLYARIHDQMVLDHMRYTNCSEQESEKYFDDSVNVVRTFWENHGKYLDKYEERFLNGE